MLALHNTYQSLLTCFDSFLCHVGHWYITVAYKKIEQAINDRSVSLRFYLCDCVVHLDISGGEDEKEEEEDEEGVQEDKDDEDEEDRGVEN